MNASQIIFVQLPSATHVEQWRAHGARMLAAPDSDPRPAGARIVWQLASANHRVLARSVGSFVDFEAAYAHATEIRDRADEITIRQIKLDRHLGYGWTASIDAAPVAICSRPYSTVRDNRDSSIAALAAFVGARIGAAPRVHVGSGRRA